MARRHTFVTIMRRPTWLDRLWYRRLGVTPPVATSRGPGRIARLVAYRFRRFHQSYATACGFFWLPCPLCDRPFGGHESGGEVPDPTSGPGYGISICSECTRARNAADSSMRGSPPPQISSEG